MSNYEYSGFDRISHNEWLGFGTYMNLDKISQLSLLPILKKKMKKKTKIKWPLTAAHHKQMSSFVFKFFS